MNSKVKLCHTSSRFVGRLGFPYFFLIASWQLIFCSTLRQYEDLLTTVAIRATSLLAQLTVDRDTAHCVVHRSVGGVFETPRSDSSVSCTHTQTYQLSGTHFKRAPHPLHDCQIIHIQAVARVQVGEGFICVRNRWWVLFTLDCHTAAPRTTVDR